MGYFCVSDVCKNKYIYWIILGCFFYVFVKIEIKNYNIDIIIDIDLLGIILIKWYIYYMIM